jgi:hypothetical protein
MTKFDFATMTIEQIIELYTQMVVYELEVRAWRDLHASCFMIARDGAKPDFDNKMRYLKHAMNKSDDHLQ